jgi:hypothetical protein
MRTFSLIWSGIGCFATVAITVLSGFIIAHNDTRAADSDYQTIIYYTGPLSGIEYKFGFKEYFRIGIYIHPEYYLGQAYVNMLEEKYEDGEYKVYLNFDATHFPDAGTMLAELIDYITGGDYSDFYTTYDGDYNGPLLPSLYENYPDEYSYLLYYTTKPDSYNQYHSIWCFKDRNTIMNTWEGTIDITTGTKYSDAADYGFGHANRMPLGYIYTLLLQCGWIELIHYSTFTSYSGFRIDNFGQYAFNVTRIYTDCKVTASISGPDTNINTRDISGHGSTYEYTVLQEGGTNLTMNAGSNHYVSKITVSGVTFEYKKGAWEKSGTPVGFLDASVTGSGQSVRVSVSQILKDINISAETKINPNVSASVTGPESNAKIRTVSGGGQIGQTIPSWFVNNNYSTSVSFNAGAGHYIKEISCGGIKFEIEYIITDKETGAGYYSCKKTGTASGCEDVTISYSSSTAQTATITITGITSDIVASAVTKKIDTFDVAAHIQLEE